VPGSWAAVCRTARNNPNVRMRMLGQFGLTWPWESLHTEALAWYGHWLKGRDTGIMDGPPIRYVLPGSEATGRASEAIWHTADQWPPAGTSLTEWALRADRALSTDEGAPGSQEFMVLGGGLGRAKPSPIDPPALLTWTTAPLAETLDAVGDVELRLIASATAADTAWMATLQHVAADGTVEDVTAGWLRASLRGVDETASVPGAPVLPCRTAVAVPIGEDVEYRIPLVGNARRFAAGDRTRLVITSDDQNPVTPAVMNFRHASVGTSSLNTIRSSSRLLLPTLAP
jgi:uncharacterized protein